MNYKTESLLTVIEFSETMLRDAESGNWETVFANEKKRSEALKDLFTVPFTQQEKQANSEHIKQILILNKRLESLTTQVRNDIRNQAGSFKKGKQAVGSYLQNSK